MKKHNTLVNKSSEAELTNNTITAASSEAKDLLQQAFDSLKDATGGKATEPKPDKFFPNGIELIYVKVEAGLTEKTKVSVEIKIAGEKGIGKALTAERETDQLRDEGE